MSHKMSHGQEETTVWDHNLFWESELESADSAEAQEEQTSYWVPPVKELRRKALSRRLPRPTQDDVTPGQRRRRAPVAPRFPSAKSTRPPAPSTPRPLSEEAAAWFPGEPGLLARVPASPLDPLTGEPLARRRTMRQARMTKGFPEHATRAPIVANPVRVDTPVSLFASRRAELRNEMQAATDLTRREDERRRDDEVALQDRSMSREGQGFQVLFQLLELLDNVAKEGGASFDLVGEDRDVRAEYSWGELGLRWRDGALSIAFGELSPSASRALRRRLRDLKALPPGG